MRPYLPTGAFGPTLILITEEAVPPGSGFGAGGANETSTSNGYPNALSVTFWSKSPMLAIVTVVVQDPSPLVVRALGQMEIPVDAD
jgi:hypothetical protein